MCGGSTGSRIRAGTRVRLFLTGFLILLAGLGVLNDKLVASQQELRAGALVFRFWPRQASAVRALVRALETAPRMPGLPEDVLDRGEIVVYLAPDQAIFDSLAPGVSDWSAGLAFPERDQIVLPVFPGRARREPLVTVLRHELAHVAISRYLGSAVPRWFHEGYAQLAAGSWQSNDAWALRVAVLLGQLPALESLSLDFAGSRLRADHAYLLSYTAVEFLYRLGGPNGFARLLQRWRETGSLDSALRRTYGLTLGQFERLWRRDVGRRYGWLLVLTQAAVFWTLLTILFLALGYWKKQRYRRKLAALEAVSRDTECGELGERDDDSWPGSGRMIDEGDSRG